MTDVGTANTPRSPVFRGTFRVASRVTNGDGTTHELTLGVLRVSPASADADSRPGQWVFWLDSGIPAKVSAILIEATARLGLIPLHFSTDFETRLRDKEPICLVADTNTLYHGSLVQALALRRGAATHVALADQVLMELQKQREVAYAPKKRQESPQVAPAAAASKNAAGAAASTATAEDPKDRWHRAARRATLLAAGGRTLGRVRAAGHIVHVARPPEAMVRYFGGGRHSGEDSWGTSDEPSEIVGSNALRDRLIIEAAVRQRVALPGVPVWLLTDDALLAAQAALEGISVGFAWLPSEIQPPLLTSPYFSPRTLQLEHVPVEDLIDELLWSTGNLLLQPEGETRTHCARIPEERRARVLSEMHEVGHAVEWRFEDIEVWSLAAGVPQKAPPPADLVAKLLSAIDGPISSGEDDASRTAIQYLQALGWVGDDGSLKPRGRALAESWRRLDYQNVDEWAAWLDDAGRDVRKLRPIATALSELRANPGASDADLAVRLSPTSARTIGAQLGLAGAFGISVRLGTKGREAEDWTKANAEQAVLDGIRTLLRAVPVGVDAVHVGRLFTSLQRPESHAMPFHVFRRALMHLESNQRIIFSGSNPDPEPIVIHVLMPKTTAPWVELAKVSLGSGSHIVTGRAAKVVQLPRGQS